MHTTVRWSTMESFPAGGIVYDTVKGDLCRMYAGKVSGLDKRIGEFL